ncbi:unnamed protein product, partial [Orchesella dallaii]
VEESFRARPRTVELECGTFKEDKNLLAYERHSCYDAVLVFCISYVFRTEISGADPVTLMIICLMSKWKLDLEPEKKNAQVGFVWDGMQTCAPVVFYILMGFSLTHKNQVE